MQFYKTHDLQQKAVIFIQDTAKYAILRKNKK